MSGRYLDTEIAIRGPIPDDLAATGLRGVETVYFDPYEVINRETNRPLDNNELLRRILRDSEIDILLRTLGNAFFPRSIDIGTTPTLIVAPNRYPRGYILINPNTTASGVVTTVVVFPAGTVFAAGVAQSSSSINVAGHGGAAFYLNITASTAVSFTVDLETQDPVTGLWAVAQSDIFGGAVAVTPQPIYANVGGLGIDQNARLTGLAVGGDVTGSIGAVLKPALAGTIAGPTIFLGNEDVNTTIGYPLLGGQKDVWYLRENTPLYGIAVATTNLRLFELQ